MLCSFFFSLYSAQIWLATTVRGLNKEKKKLWRKELYIFTSAIYLSVHLYVFRVCVLDLIGFVRSLLSLSTSRQDRWMDFLFFIASSASSSSLLLSTPLRSILSTKEYKEVFCLPTNTSTSLCTQICICMSCVSTYRTCICVSVTYISRTHIYADA